MAVSELLSGGNGRIVIGADQGLKALDMAVAVDVLPAVIAHSRNLPPERQPVPPFQIKCNWGIFLPVWMLRHLRSRVSRQPIFQLYDQVSHKPLSQGIVGLRCENP
jgi:hypothetical protein